MEKLIISFVLVQVMLMQIALGKTPYKSCKTTSSKLTDVTISGCDSIPCKLKKGTNAGVSLTFTAGEDISTVKANVHATISNIPLPVPWTPPNVDGCKNCNLQCPLKKGKSYTYKNVIPVKSSYPNFQLVVKWELTDGNNDILCIEVPCQIVS